VLNVTEHPLRGTVVQTNVLYACRSTNLTEPRDRDAP
jgi:hypothetical protein